MYSLYKGGPGKSRMQEKPSFLGLILYIFIFH